MNEWMEWINEWIENEQKMNEWENEWMKERMNGVLRPQIFIYYNKFWNEQKTQKSEWINGVSGHKSIDYYIWW